MSGRFLSLVSPVLTIAGVIAGIALIGQSAEAKKVLLPPPRVFHFKIDDAMPMHELLPPPPTLAKLPSATNEDLALVPDLFFSEPITKADDMEEKMAHIMAKMKHLNARSTDGFMKELIASRADLRGMPFLMGNDCRTEEKEAQRFAEAVSIVQRQIQASFLRNLERSDGANPNEEADAKRFWEGIPKLIADDKQTMLGKAAKVDIDRAVVAALTQMLAAKAAPYRAGLAKYLATVQHADATKALAKLALYAPEDAVRKEALDGLKGRPSKDYSAIVMQGFRYPLPAVSKRAAETIVKLQDKSVLPSLVEVLEQPDPRAPATKNVDGKEVSFVREMVRVNHHHNCLLCHAPGTSDDVAKGVLIAPVVLADQPLPSPFEGYGRQASPNIFVRIDMTYLRQDFSMTMKVEGAKPWPEMQRFDFFVRTRELTAQEKAQREKELSGRTPPNHMAAQYALRELAGRAPTETTPAAWRRLLSE